MYLSIGGKKLMLLVIGLFLAFCFFILLIFVLILRKRFLKTSSALKNLEEKYSFLVQNDRSQGTIKEILTAGVNQGKNLETEPIKKVKEFVSDPLFEDAKDDLSGSLKSFLKTTSTLADNYQILFGISGGLLAMSFVALAFHFFENVLKVETSSVRWATAYLAFFAVLTIGIFKNKYMIRKLARLENEKLNMELRFKDQLDNLRLSYEEILSKSQDEKNLLIDGHSKMLEELDVVLKERENSLEQLKRQEKEARRNSKRRWLFKKLNS